VLLGAAGKKRPMKAARCEVLAGEGERKKKEGIESEISQVGSSQSRTGRKKSFPDQVGGRAASPIVVIESKKKKKRTRCSAEKKGKGKEADLWIRASRWPGDEKRPCSRAPQPRKKREAGAIKPPEIDPPVVYRKKEGEKLVGDAGTCDGREKKKSSSKLYFNDRLPAEEKRVYTIVPPIAPVNGQEIESRPGRGKKKRGEGGR